MGPIATINVRLPLELKERGSAVLDRNNVTVTDLVRELYSYMEREQRIPSCLSPESPEDAVARRRRQLRECVGVLRVPEGANLKSLRDERMAERYGEFL